MSWPTLLDRVAVRRGARRLDRRSPAWTANVNVDALDLLSSTRCVLGQVYGGVGSGLAHLGLTYTDLLPYGFDGVGQDQRERREKLWRRAVERRRGT